MLEARPTCRRCRRSERTCYCARLKPFRPAFELVLLQHPKEIRKAIGTARMTHLSVLGSRLINGIECDAEVRDLLEDPTRHCVVLYPGPRSVDISNGDRSFVPSGRKLVVFVIDGTWACANTMLRLSPAIAALPQIRFTPERKSEYLIRKQPAEHCLSTLEASHRLIDLLDPSAEADAMLDVFRAMVGQQAAFGPPVQA